MKYFLDCEFIEDGKTIDLISIGIVAEDVREYYACNNDCDLSRASDWVKENVLVNLPSKHISVNPGNPDVSPLVRQDILTWKMLDTIKKDLLSFFMGTSISIWGEYSAYDFVVFSQLMSRGNRATHNPMCDCYPKFLPWYFNDVIQLAEHLGYTADDLPPSLETEGNHNALLGAKTVKARYDWLIAKANE